MKRTSTRRSQPTDSFELICALGDKLSEQYGQVRYVETIWHNGNQWTIRADWERLENGQWMVFELPVSNY